MSKQYMLTVLAIALLVAIVTLLLFDVKKVPDYKWNKSYDFKSHEPFGLAGFNRLLKAKFGKNNVEVISKIEDINLDSISNSLLIIVNNEIKLYQDFIEKYISKGNSVVFITNELDFIQYAEYDEEDTSRIDIINPFLTFSDYYMDTCFVLEYGDSYNSFDSTKHQYCYYLETFEKPKNYRFTYFDDVHSPFLEISSIKNEGAMAVAVNDSINGELIFHTNPILFTNSGINQSLMLPYFNHLFGRFNRDKVLITNISRMDGIHADGKNPLAYVLSQPGLKHAYYTMIALVLLYLFLGSKRKQKAIPVISKIDNSSLSYINVLSDLYLAQDQNEKLIKRLEVQFYHFCKSKYYLDHKGDGFVMKLNKKSEIPTDSIERILRNFENVHKGFTFTDKQLFDVNASLDFFYNNCK